MYLLWILCVGSLVKVSWLNINFSSWRLLTFQWNWTCCLSHESTIMISCCCNRCFTLFHKTSFKGIYPFHSSIVIFKKGSQFKFLDAIWEMKEFAPDLTFNFKQLKCNLLFKWNHKFNYMWYFSLSSYLSTHCTDLKSILRNCLPESQVSYAHTRISFSFDIYIQL